MVIDRRSTSLGSDSSCLLLFLPFSLFGFLRRHYLSQSHLHRDSSHRNMLTSSNSTISEKRQNASKKNTWITSSEEEFEYSTAFSSFSSIFSQCLTLTYLFLISLKLVLSNMRRSQNQVYWSRYYNMCLKLKRDMLPILRSKSVEIGRKTFFMKSFYFL